MKKSQEIIKPSNKSGRPSIVCDNRVIKIITDMLILGAEHKEVCKALGISASTYYKWRKENKKLSNAIEEIEHLQTDNVEKSLYKRATGFWVTETTTNKSGESTKERYIVPDTAALIFWLTNRRKDKWQNKQVHDVNARPLVKRNVKRFDGHTEDE